MATNRRPYYRQNGVAAYDIYSTSFDANAARALELPRELPEERKQPVRHQKVKAKLIVKPFSIVGILAAAFLLSMVVFGYVQLYEASSQVGALNSQLTQVEQDNARLRSSYESSIHLTQIEQRAKELGLKQPTGNQIVYLNISGNDRAQIIAPTVENVFVRTWSAIRDSFVGILEYFF